MRMSLAGGGYTINVVAINIKGGEASQMQLTSRCRFDLVQDTAAVNAWQLMSGAQDDIFIYRAGGTLAPGGYLKGHSALNTNLSDPMGYTNVQNAIIAADKLGAGENCWETPPPSRQLPGDINQDAQLDLADAVGLLAHLFQGTSSPLPCDGGDALGAGNRNLLDANADGALDITDPVHVLSFLFRGGPPPALGVECAPVAGCPEACGA